MQPIASYRRNITVERGQQAAADSQEHFQEALQSLKKSSASLRQLADAMDQDALEGQGRRRLECPFESAI